jgi:hypothetical protein
MCPTRIRIRGPIRQPRAKPAKKAVPMMPISVVLKPSIPALSGSKVTRSPLPISKRAAALKRIAMDLLTSDMAMAHLHL